MNPGIIAGMKSTVTSFDVARLAQVSQSAVSRTFTPGASVSEATRMRVMDAAHKLGYRPNAHARSLITGRSRIIGLVLSYLENLFYPVALQRLAERLQRDGYHVLLFINHNPNADELVTEILQYHVDGIVLAASTLSSALARNCADADIPVVLFNRVMADAGPGATRSVSSVRGDNAAGGRALADFLVAGGHRRLAYIAGNEESSTNLERERGFREGLAAAGLHIWSRATGNYDFAQARQAALTLFAPGRERPDAVFVASDHMAFAVMDALRFELGLRVPEDVSVVGFDNVPQGEWGAYQLTTFEQPVDTMVEATVGLLQERLREEGAGPARNVVVPGALIVRASARLPATAAAAHAFTTSLAPAAGPRTTPRKSPPRKSPI
jgi:DNA-binding LacI/PurR family transcriptional regulator